MTQKILPVKYFWLAVLCILVLQLSACNTVEGMGRDIKSAGDAITGK